MLKASLLKVLLFLFGLAVGWELIIVGSLPIREVRAASSNGVISYYLQKVPS